MLVKWCLNNCSEFRHENIIMKGLICVLVVIFFALQYKLWVEKGGIQQVTHLQKSIDSQTKENKKLGDRNQALVAEIKDLKNGQTAVEERARNDLGMVKSGEVFYQIVSETKK